MPDETTVETEATGLLRTLIRNACVNTGEASSGQEARSVDALLMGHTDVVPVNPAGWRRNPFGAELVDGIVWGRGAIDMLNLTATMAVATRRLARNDVRPRGTLIYLAVADEEAGGVHGAGHLVEHEPEAVRCDAMFHGHDERVDTESLRLSALMWEALCRDFLG